MDYKKLYESLIDNRLKSGKPDGYSELHHIIPSSLGGTNAQENLVSLTAREHFIAHRLLAKIHPNSGMVHAVFKMACANKVTGKFKVTNRTYEQLRIKHSYRVSTDEVAKKKKSLALKGKKQSPEHVKARTESRKKNVNWHSKETKLKIKLANAGKEGVWKGKQFPKEMIEKRKKTMRERGGWEWSEERKLAQSERILANPIKRPPLTDEQKQKLRIEKTRIVVCPHCGKEGTMFIMPRWHFDNCKKRFTT